MLPPECKGMQGEGSYSKGPGHRQASDGRRVGGDAAGGQGDTIRWREMKGPHPKPEVAGRSRGSAGRGGRRGWGSGGDSFPFRRAIGASACLDETSELYRLSKPN